MYVTLSNYLVLHSQTVNILVECFPLRTKNCENEKIFNKLHITTMQMNQLKIKPFINLNIKRNGAKQNMPEAQNKKSVLKKKKKI